MGAIFFLHSTPRNDLLLLPDIEIRSSRATNVLDLQYLFFTPFGMVFVFHDRLHRDLWPATTTEATFVSGAELKADLQRYVQPRAATAAARDRGETPPYYAANFTPETSLIARLRAKYMKPPGGTRSPTT
jgi:hypothetical protein